MKGYRVKINVKDKDKVCERIVEIPGEMTFLDLGYVIEDAFGVTEGDALDFNLGDLRVVSEDDYFDENNVILLNEIINDYFEQYRQFDCCYQDWEFEFCVLETLDDVISYPVIVDWKGDNLEVNLGAFNIDLANDSLSLLEVAEVINRHPIRNDFEAKLTELFSIIKQREIKGRQIIELDGEIATLYWVIIETVDGYVLELFESYSDFLEGYCNLPELGINHVFFNGYTFMLADKVLDYEKKLSDDSKFVAFFNQAGYLPTLIDVDAGKMILKYLDELLIGLSADNSSADDSMIISLTVKNNHLIDSNVHEHELQLDIEEYNISYGGNEVLNNFVSTSSRVCLDVVCLPTPKSYATSELALYAVIASEDDYVIKEIHYPNNQVMSDALIDIMITFFNQNGIPEKLMLNNLNVLLLIMRFLVENKMDYDIGDIDREISEAVADNFSLQDDLILEQLLQECEGKTEEEIHEFLEGLLKEDELLN